VADYDEVHLAIAEIIAKNWSDLGFNVTLEKLGTIQNNDWYKFTESVPTDICDDLYAENLRAGRFEAILFDYVAYSPDPFSVLSSFAKPFSGRGMDMSNPDEYLLTPHITGYDSEEYNALMEEIFAEKTIANRAENLRKAEEILMKDLPIVPVVFNLSATVTSSKLKGETIDYYNVLQFKKCSISSYSKYQAAGKAYINANFAEMAFTQANECPYRPADDSAEALQTALDLFKTSNTIYSQYYLDEKEDTEKSK
jgi:ABC-type transport system substrate-binding protein